MHENKLPLCIKLSPNAKVQHYSTIVNLPLSILYGIMSIGDRNTEAPPSYWALRVYGDSGYGKAIITQDIIVGFGFYTMMSVCSHTRHTIIILKSHKAINYDRRSQT